MYKDILRFWFEDLSMADWFKSDKALDLEIENRFGALHFQATQCELDHWRTTIEGRLAEIIILDQFSRNIYRGKPAAFAFDSLALALAQEAISLGWDKDLTPIQRSFLYMPYMHSESLKVHQQAVVLFEANGLEGNIDFEYKHKVIIEKFGRYPHRNQILGRESTAEEVAFLLLPNSGF